jgi:hypothetical protein
MAGYIKNWNLTQIQTQLWSAYHICSDSRQDGFTTWPVKQDLYRIKWMVDDILRHCPTYSMESEWLKEQEQNRLINILKNEK